MTKQERKNQMYGVMNWNFDTRAMYLTSKGYKYEEVKEYKIAVFVKRSPMFGVHTIPAGTVLNANADVWEDITEQVEARA